MRGVVVHFGGVGVGESEHVSCKLDHHALHAQADAERGHVMLATPFQGHEFAFYATLAESGSYDHSVKTAKLHVGILFGELFGMYIAQIELAVVVGGCLKQRFVD